MHTSTLLHLFALATLALLPACSSLPLQTDNAPGSLQFRQDSALVQSGCCPSCDQDCSASSPDPDNLVLEELKKEKRNPAPLPDPLPSPTPGEADALKQLQDLAQLLTRDHTEVLVKRQNATGTGTSLSDTMNSFLHTDTMKKFILTAGSFGLKEVAWAMDPDS